MATTNLKRDLRRVGAQRQKARQQAREASARLAELVQEARDAGMTKVEIARLAQITRPALDTMLRQSQNPSRPSP